MTESELDVEIAKLQARITELRRIRYAGSRAERKAKRETTARVQAIKKAYTEGTTAVVDIAREFSTSTGAIQALVRKYNWPRRSPAQAAAQNIRRERERATP